jgi:hypothetical protein
VTGVDVRTDVETLERRSIGRLQQLAIDSKRAHQSREAPGGGMRTVSYASRKFSSNSRSHLSSSYPRTLQASRSFLPSLASAFL